MPSVTENIKTNTLSEHLTYQQISATVQHGQTNIKIFFIINPIAGGIDKTNLAEELKKFCDKCKIDHKIEESPKDMNDEKFRKIIDEWKPDALVAAGGDGTANFAGKLVLNTDIALGIIPLGSSNALAKNLNIPETLPGALDLLQNFHTKEIDTVCVNGIPSLHIIDLGFNAKLIKRFHKRSLRGVGSYAWCLMQELMHYRFFKYKVHTSKERIEGKAFSISVTNARIYGTQAAINPTGKINDGLFEICIIKPFPFYAMVKMFFQLFHKTINRSPYSIFIRTKSAVIENIENEAVHIDGEPVKLSERLELEVMPKSLKVIVP